MQDRCGALTELRGNDDGMTSTATAMLRREASLKPFKLRRMFAHLFCAASVTQA
jgi:hypothetical protein